MGLRFLVTLGATVPAQDCLCLDFFFFSEKEVNFNLT